MHFSKEDLRQVVETAKKILMKENIDSPIAGQTSSTPFMNIQDGYVSKEDSFNTQNGLEEKIDLHQ